MGNSMFIESMVKLAREAVIAFAEQLDEEIVWFRKHPEEFNIERIRSVIKMAMEEYIQDLERLNSKEDLVPEVVNSLED